MGAVFIDAINDLLGLDIQILVIKRKLFNADYPPRFVNSVIRQFNEKCNDNARFL